MRRYYLQALNDHAAGKPLIGMDPASYRLRSGRTEAPADMPFEEVLKKLVRVATPIAAE
jgi:hypothetical protein